MTNFLKKWRLSQGEQTRIIQRLRNYLFKEVLKDEPYALINDWCRANYWHFFNPVQNNYKRACPLTNDTDDFEDEFIQNMTWHVQLTSHHRRDQTELNHHIESLNIPDEIQNRIDGCIQQSKKYTVVFIIVSWENADGPDAHAIMLFFDLEDKFQWLFDPDDADNNPISMTKAFSRRSYIPGFEVIPYRYLLEDNLDESLQTHYETINQHQTRTCGIMVVLVLICCLRFDYWDTFRMSRFLKQISRNDEDKKSLIQKFVSWYTTVHDNDYDRQFISDALQKIPSVGHSVCGVYSTISNKICSRRTKDHQQFCWQHKSTMQNE